MKTTRTFLVALIATMTIVLGYCSYCGSVSATPTPDESSSATSSTSTLNFHKYYIIMPVLEVRADPETPGKVGKVFAGQEVELLYSAGNYSMFNYQDENGETRTGATWTGAIALGIRIHLLEDAYLFHRPNQKRTELGTISTWREPTDPDLIILSEEKVNGEIWLYVLSIEDCRAGYMRSDIQYEIVE